LIRQAASASSASLASPATSPTYSTLPPTSGLTRWVKYSFSAFSRMFAAICSGIPATSCDVDGGMDTFVGLIRPRNSACPPRPVPWGNLVRSMPW
jgi:hypothetical protein